MLLRWLSGKESTCQCRRHKRHGFDPWSRRSTGVGMATHSSILAWKILWTEEPGRPQSMGPQRWTQLSKCVCTRACVRTPIHTHMYQQISWLADSVPCCQQSLQRFQGGSVVKNPPVKEGITGDVFDTWVRKIPWRRKQQPTPVFLPGESQGRGSLVGCRLGGRTESDTTEATQQQQGGITNAQQHQVTLT